MNFCVFLYRYTHVHSLAESPQFCGARGGVDASYRIYAQNAAEWWCRCLEWCSLKAFCGQVKIWAKGREKLAFIRRSTSQPQKAHSLRRKTSNISLQTPKNFQTQPPPKQTSEISLHPLPKLPKSASRPSKLPKSASRPPKTSKIGEASEMHLRGL